MLRISYIFIFLLSAIVLNAQSNSPKIKFDAKITSVEDQGSHLDFVKVYITINGTLADSVLAQNGRLFYTLDTGKVYKIEFTKSGYVSKHLVVSTADAPDDVKSKSSLKVDVSLFKYKKDLNVDFLKTKPIGIARYNYEDSKLDWDRDYTRYIVELIITATLEHYKLTHPNE